MMHFSRWVPRHLLVLIVMALVPSAWALSSVSPAGPVAKGMNEDNSPNAFVAEYMTATTSAFETFSGWTVFSAPTHGVVGFTAPTNKNTYVTYSVTTPNYVGSDSFIVRATGTFGSINVTFNVTIIQVNDRPTFTLAASHACNEDGGSQSVPGFASGFNPGNAYESGQSLSFYTVTADDPTLFSVQPAINTAGTLTYTPASNRNGSTIIRVTATDNGGTTYGGLNTSIQYTATLTINPISDGRLYATVGGGGNGSSWASPFTLKQAMDYSSSGEDVWVAAGTHTPGSSRGDSFMLKTGVVVYGGFAGSETLLSQRDIRANVTIMSGDIGSIGVQTDNSYQVVQAIGNGTLDGFRIQNGYANGGVPQNEGGGLYITASPTIRDCLIISNTSANFTGGGASIRGASLSPTFNRCIFQSNSASYGGAIYTNSGVELVNCVFQSNSASTEGGAIRTSAGGSPTAFNCTFVQNTSPASSGAVHTLSNFALTNCILWANTTYPLASTSGTRTVTNCLIQNGDLGGFTNLGGLVTTDPQFTSISDGDGPDNRWGTGDDGLFPGAASPARDAGTDTGAPAVDLRTSPRPSGLKSDIGAYERRVYHVTTTGVGAGGTWASASSNLVGILAAAQTGDEVWVQSGTYKASAGTDETASFTISTGVGLYGGFSGSETVLSARNWTTNRTHLSGDLGGGNRTRNIISISGTGSVVDGFIISDAVADGPSPGDAGGGIRISSATTTITNCVLANNTASYAGGGIFFTGSGAANIQNCLFLNNAADYGGGIEFELGTNTSYIGNCTFVGNTATTYGPAFETASLTGSAPILVNCLMWGNGPGNAIYSNFGTAPITYYSLVEGSGGAAWAGGTWGSSGGGNLDVDPQFYNQADPDGADNLYFTADDGLVLLTGSPAANTALIWGLMPNQDIRRQPRPTGVGPDMGCYEGQVGRVSFSTSTASVGEGVGTTNVSVALAAAADFPVTVNYSVTGGTAINGVGVGTGVATWDFPLHTWYHDARTTSIYLTSELGGAATFRSLVLDVTQVPLLTMNSFTVRMKHTGLAAFASADWGVTTGWDTVYSGNLTVTSTGPLVVNFNQGDNAFAYDGAQNVLVDISFDNNTYTDPRGYVRVSTPGGNRSIFYNTDSGFGNPLTWAGTTNPTPFLSTNVPNIKFSTNVAGGMPDYRLASGSVTIPVGATSASIPVAILQDTLDEVDETIIITLAGPTNAVLASPTTHTLTILDDDAAPTVQFAASTASGTEAATSPAINVTLSTQSAKTVTVTQSYDGTSTARNADPQRDVNALSSSVLTFTPGVVSQTIPSFSVVNTPVYDEDNETAVFKLTAPGNATLGSVTTHTYTIQDLDTSAVQLSAAAVSVTESSATPDTFTVVLDTRPYIPPTSDAVVRVDFTVSDDTEAEVSADGTTYASTVSVWFSSAGVGTGLNSGSPAAYNSALTIRVRSVDDDIDDGSIGSSLTVSTANVSTTDTRYAALANQVISITTHDDADAAGFTVEPLQNPVPGGVPPLPLAEAWFSRSITAIDGSRTVLTFADVTGVVVGMRTYNYVDGTYGFVTSVNGGAQQVTLTTALGPTDPVGNAMAFGFENVYVVKLATEPTGSVRLSVDAEDDTRFHAYFPDTDTLDASNWATGIQVIVYAFDNATFEANATFDVILKTVSTSAAEYVDVEPPDPEVLIINDDVRGVSISPTGVAVSEGGISQAYAVSLTSEPVGGSVTITPTPGNAQATVATDLGATLVFTAANWYLTQNVYVTAVDDEDYDPAAVCLVSHGVSGADYGAVSAGDVTVTVGDNESLDPIISPSSGLVTSEGGGTADFTVRLAARPAVGEVITIGPMSVVNDTSLETEATVTAGGTLYFARTALGTGDGYSAVNASLWSNPVTVELTGGPDLGADGDQLYDVVIPAMSSSLGGGSSFHGVDVADVTDCINTDNAVAGVVVTGGTLSVTEGGIAKDYTLKLTWNPATPPTGNYVLVSITSANPGDATVSPGLVLFTGPFPADPATYNATASNIKTITVSAVDDSIDEAAEIVSIAHAVVLSDDGTAQFTTGLVINSAQATVTDNDVAGVEVLAPAQLITSEAGGTANFSVRLKTQPTDDVTIGLSLSGDTDEVLMTTLAEPGLGGIKTLNFTTANWSTPQSVTVIGQNDFLDDGDRSFTIVTGATASATDAFYGGAGIGVPDLDGLNLDNDAVGVTVSKSSVSVVEAGATDTYALSLTSAPSGTVTIALSGASQVGFEVGVTPVTAVYFAAAATGTGDGTSAANARTWNSALNLVVRAIDDQIDEATSHQATITHTVSGGDYTGVVATAVTANITDHPTLYNAGITVTPNGAMATLAEGGSAGAIAVVLASKPTGNVRIAVASADTAVATVSPTLLTFTPANWSVAQNLSITPIDDLIDQDTDGTQGNADDARTSSISFTVTSFDPAYDARVVAPVVASVADEDVAGVTVTPLAGLVVSEDGDVANFTVVLDRMPRGDVTIPLVSSDPQRASLSTASLTFTPANWSLAQAVSITGQDLDGVHDTGGSPLVTIQTGDPTSTVVGEAYDLLNAGDVGDPTVTVQGSNAAPRIESIPDAVIAEVASATPIALPSFNVDSGQAGESQNLAISVNSSNPALFPTISAALAGAPAMPTDLAIPATVTVTPAPFLSGTATVTVTVTDDATIATDAVAKQTIAVFTVTVTAVNNAPEVVITAGTTPEHVEGGAATPVMTSLTVTDVDNSTLTSATVTITNPLDGDREILQATVGGTGIVAFYDTASRVLYLNSGTPRPLADYQQVLRTVAYRNSDDNPTTGTSRVLSVVVSDGTSDSVAATALVDVTATNDPPVLSGTVEAFPDIDEDEVANSGFAVDDLIGGGVQLVDPDSGTLGVAVDDTSGTPTGVWQYSLNGGGAWTDFPDLTGDLHLVLSADGSAQNRIRFVPNADENGTVLLGWRAWDGFDALADGDNPSVTGVGTSPSAYSSSVLVAPLVIQPVNDAPILAGVGTLTDIDEDSSVHDGDSVESLLSGRVTDVDAGAISGIAVTGVGADGTWQYSLDDGSNWFAFPAVTPATATVLRANGNLVRIRFVPDADFNGTSSITYCAWDASDALLSGTADVDATTVGGVTPFSSVSVTDNVTVNPVNDAPVLNGISGSSTIDTIVEDIVDGSNVGVSVTDVLANLDTIDVDTGALAGIAVTAVDDSNGTWQFDIGGGWVPFAAVSDASARLLADGGGNLIRFVPDADFVGSATITLRLWDQTAQANGATTNVSINGGTSAYSSGDVVMDVVVTAVNDPPTVDLNGLVAGVDMVTPALYVEGAPAQFVHIAGVSVSDPDSALLTGGTIVLQNHPDGADEVIAVNTAGLSITATWVPATWTITLSGSASASEYQQLLNSLTYINGSQTPDGSTNRSIAVVLSDGALSSPTATGLVQVQPVNDAPQVTTNTALTVPLRGDAAINETGPVVTRLLATDVDSLASSLFYTISLPTGQGTLYLDTGTTSGILDGGDTVLSPGSTFLQTQLIAGLIRYVHGGSGSSDGFAFTVSDGSNASSLEVFQIIIDRSPPDIILDPTAVGALNFTEGDSELNIGPLATVTDDDSADFDGGSLTITIQGGVDASETLDIDVLGDIDIVGSGVSHLGVAFGTLVSGGTAGQDVVLSLNALATETQVQGFIRAVTYINIDEAPTSGARIVQAVMSDGDGDTSATATRIINLIPVNDPPTIAAASIITPKDIAYGTNLVVGDIDSYPLTLTVLTPPGKGTLSGALDSGSSGPDTSLADALTSRFFTYTPTPGEEGADSFVIRVTDPFGATAQATFPVVIIGGAAARPWIVSRPPVEAEAGSPLSYDIVADFRDLAIAPTAGQVSYSLVGSLPADVTLGGFTPSGTNATLTLTLGAAAMGVIQAAIVISETANNTTGYQPITIVIVPAGSLGG